VIKDRLLSMLDQIKEEVTGGRLEHRVLLQVEHKGKQRGVLLANAEANRSTSPRETKILTVDNAAVPSLLIDPFFLADPAVLAPPPIQLPELSGALTYHAFLSHVHNEATDQCGLIHDKLEKRGFKVWFDQALDNELNYDAMQRGVSDSRTYFLFLTKSVFERSAVLMELTEATCAARPIVCVIETDQGMPGFVTIEVLIARLRAIVAAGGVPAEVAELFGKVEVLPFRRRLHEQELMLEMIARRLVR